MSGFRVAIFAGRVFLTNFTAASAGMVVLDYLNYLHELDFPERPDLFANSQGSS